LWSAIAANPLGLILPVLIVLVSIVLTWLLFRHFSKQMSSSPDDER
jgi:hypothetical protein